MASSKRTAASAVVLLFVLALAPSGIVLHEHDGQVHHADCDACHFRHLSGVESEGTPVSSAPDLVARAVVSAATDGERGAALGIRPTRGPPA